MNPKQYFILIKGDIKTTEVLSCELHSTNNKWEVKFNNSKVFYYAAPNLYGKHLHYVELEKWGVKKHNFSFSDMIVMGTFEIRYEGTESLMVCALSEKKIRQYLDLGLLPIEKSPKEQSSPSDDLAHLLQNHQVSVWQEYRLGVAVQPLSAFKEGALLGKGVDHVCEHFILEGLKDEQRISE